MAADRPKSTESSLIEHLRPEVRYSKADAKAEAWVVTPDNTLDKWLGFSIEGVRTTNPLFRNCSNEGQVLRRLGRALTSPDDALREATDMENRQQTTDLINLLSFPNVSSFIPALSAATAVAKGSRTSQQDSASVESIAVEEKVIPRSQPEWQKFCGSVFENFKERIRNDPTLAYKNLHSGASAVTAIVYGDTCIAALAGDGILHQIVEDNSGNILCTNELKELTHNAQNPQELKRISDLGGKLNGDRTPGGLNVFRGFGDLEDKLISPVPEIKILPPSSDKIINRWIVLSSDGAVKLTPEDIAGVFREHKTADSEDIARRLLKLTELPDKSARDNVSFVVLKIKDHSKKMMIAPNQIIIGCDFDGHGAYGHDIAKYCSTHFVPTLLSVLALGSAATLGLEGLAISPFAPSAATMGAPATSPAKAAPSAPAISEVPNFRPSAPSAATVSAPPSSAPATSEVPTFRPSAPNAATMDSSATPPAKADPSAAPATSEKQKSRWSLWNLISSSGADKNDNPPPPRKGSR